MSFERLIPAGPPRDGPGMRCLGCGHRLHATHAPACSQGADEVVRAHCEKLTQQELPSPVNWELDDTYDDEHGGICACGVTVERAGDEKCRVCAEAPHDRECACNECEEYWATVCGEGST